MAKIINLDRLLLKLDQRAVAASKEANVSVLTGYTVAYAVYVHENMQAQHTVGQAKFLEQPARELKPVLAEIVREAMSQGKTLTQALLLAALRLQREGQLLVPVDTGVLKNSAFTRIEG